jgi:hypothetical protein
MKLQLRFLTGTFFLACTLSLFPLTSAQAEPKTKAAAAVAEDEEGDEDVLTAEDYLAASNAILDNMDAAATLLETVKDEKSAKIASVKLTKAGKELEALFIAMNELPKPTPEIEKALDGNTDISKKGEAVAAHFQEAANGLTQLEDKQAAALMSPSLMAYGKVASEQGKGSAGKDDDAEAEEEEADDAPPAKPTAENARKLANNVLDNMDEAAEILESVSDKESALEAGEELKATGAELKAIFGKIKAMGQLPESEKSKMDEDADLKTKGEAVTKRFQEAANNLSKLSDKEALQTIAPSLMAYGKIAQMASELDKKDAPPASKSKSSTKSAE